MTTEHTEPTPEPTPGPASGPEPAGTSAPAPSGDPRVDAALRRAEELAGTSPDEHVTIYEDVHRTLAEVLADAGSTDGGRTDSSSSTDSSSRDGG